MSLLHPGHDSGAPSLATRSPFAPQCGQNCIPANITPKQAGHPIEVSVDAQ
ncbi:MAG: hypothetical protein ABIR92_01485 [Gemmatimonadaceae bacterium]